MPDVMDHNLLVLFIHPIYDAIVSDTYPVKLFRAGLLHGLTRKWILPQNLNLP